MATTPVSRRQPRRCDRRSGGGRAARWAEQERATFRRLRGKMNLNSSSRCKSRSVKVETPVLFFWKSTGLLPFLPLQHGYFTLFQMTNTFAFLLLVDVTVCLNNLYL